jgi:hypothetical protein
MQGIFKGVLFLSLLLLSQSAIAEKLATRPGKILVERLIAIGESGRLADWSYVGGVLQAKFTSRVAMMEPFARNCAPGYAKRQTKVTYFDAASGLQPTPFGRSSITRPGFGIINSEPAEISGETKIRYYVSENHDCSGYVQSSNDIEADLEISPLSTYDCISAGELLEWFPDARQGDATDGALVYYYESARTKQNGTELSFTSFVATPCLLSLRLSQRPRDTLRYQAAQQKQEACMLPHEERFCRSHPPFGWGAGDIQDEMASYAVRQCGTLDKFLTDTPKNARPTNHDEPFEAYDPDKSTPCSRVSARLRGQNRSRK